MNGPWQVGWNGVALAAIGCWRFWTGLRSVWPAVAASSRTWGRWNRHTLGAEVRMGVRPKE